jgi:thymidylate synthase
MRSGDMALGIPFNIASYALLTHLVSRVVGMTPGEVIINIADCHLYSNHVEGVREWLAGQPTDMPTLAFSEAITTNTSLEIDDFHTKYTIDDIIVADYWPQQSIKLDMVV